MNGADLVIVAILGLSALVGMWRGLMREALSLAVWVAAIVAAMMFGANVAALYANWIELPSAQAALGYLTVFLLVLIVGGLLNWLIGRIVDSTGLRGTDRLFGLGFGLLRGGVIVAALILVLGFTPFPRDPWWQQSTLIPRFEPVAQWLAEWLPEAWEDLRELKPADQPVNGEAIPASATS